MSIARVDRIRLRFGPRPDSGPTTVDLGPVTVLVGPNNGGKSRTLRDLQEYASRGNQIPMPGGWTGGVIVDAIDMEYPESLQAALDFLEPRTEGTDGTSVRIRTFPLAIVGGNEEGRLHISLEELNPDLRPPEMVGAKILGPYSVALNGRERFHLAGATQTGRLNAPPTSHWMAIERDPALFEEVDSMIYAAFERHLVIQTFNPPQLQPALSDTPIPNELRQSTSAEAVEFLQASTPLEEFSDGVQVFCGLVAALATVPHLLLLIDEPEAFLHPTLSRRLGANLARIARERDARLICATHSADFLLGCLAEVPQTTVVRLEYPRSVPSCHVLEAEKVGRLSREPLLRSADALDALFARSAVICEADSDRAFYEEINRRLGTAEGKNGALDSVFLNAQNWQTTVNLATPLREAGVPSAVILDLDTLTEDAAWPDLVAMANLSTEDRNRILQVRSEARDAIVECGRPAKGAPWRAKSEGISALTDQQRETVQIAIQELARIGIFIIEAGELENWLPQLGCTNKQRWLTDMLTRLGAIGDPAYVEPTTGDVWDFVETVARWLEDPARAGMPGE